MTIREVRKALRQNIKLGKNLMARKVLRTNEAKWKMESAIEAYKFSLLLLKGVK